MYSRHSNYKKMIVIMVLALSTIICFFISVNLGAYKASLSDVFKAIFIDKEGLNRNIIWKVRVPRTFVAAFVGINLSISGGILQGVMRNPLASPSMIGVSSGAGLMATIILVLMPNATYMLTPFAFIGAIVTTAIIYTVSWQNGIQPLRMILSGIAITSLMNAIVQAILIFFPDRVQNTLGFQIGSLAAKTWSDFYLILPYTIIGFLLSLWMANSLNILGLGDEMARGLGISVEFRRCCLIAIASLLAASAVSVVGILGFVGLIVPHITRKIIGSDYRFLFPASALMGASLMMLSDTVARVIIDPIEIPVGIVLSLIGAPFFLYLLRGGVKKHV